MNSIIKEIIAKVGGKKVPRTTQARSSHPVPTSRDLEVWIADELKELGFDHSVKLKSPDDSAILFIYDFWRRKDKVAIEIMGYRADDEVYKDLFKFHVDPEVSTGILFVPRYKWVSGVRYDTNYNEAKKAIALAKKKMDVKRLYLIAYDWKKTKKKGYWELVICE